MPVCLHRNSPGYNLSNDAKLFLGRPLIDIGCSSDTCLDIGLINNMPDGALQSTERQFLTLLDSASDSIPVRVSLYAMPEIPRSDWGRQHVNSYYEDVANLGERRLDGLVITGTEPRASCLTDEPYWPTIAGVFDWAEENTHSTIFSCLAAHAAVLHIDGIPRRPLDDKRFGLFECKPVSDHRLTSGLPSRYLMPHSRWNEISEADLEASGYRFLSRSEKAGADAFVKQRKSLFVFFQGHPEYDANTLLLEYRRDIGRYLRRERNTYPIMPCAYVGREAARALAALRKRAILERSEDLLSDFPTAVVEKSLAKPWRGAASLIYANWLTNLAVLAERRLKRRQSGKERVRESEPVLLRRLTAGG